MKKQKTKQLVGGLRICRRQSPRLHALNQETQFRAGFTVFRVFNDCISLMNDEAKRHKRLESRLQNQPRKAFKLSIAKVSLSDTMKIRKITRVKRLRFGEQELRLLFALEQEKNPVFTIDDARKILGSSDASVKNVLKRLKKKNRVIPLQKGVYLFAPLKSGVEGFWSEHAFKIVPYLVKTWEYYVGFVTALNYWGMTEQIPVVVCVALKRQKKSLEAVQTKFVFVTKKRLGDFTKISFADTEVNVSSPEQTILDALAFPEYCLGVESAAKAIWYYRDKLDWKKLIALAKNDSIAVQRRLGFLLELLRFKKQAKQMEESVRGFNGFSWLDYSAQKKEFEYSKKWGLKLNVGKRDLLEFQNVY